MATTPRAYEWEGYEQIIDDATETGAIFHFFDTYAQAIYPDGTLKYKWGLVPQGHWSELILSDETELEAFDYKLIKSDHPATGSLYMLGLARGTVNDVIYLFRYDYMRDVSELVQDATLNLQSDNPIAEIRANIKNVNDSMFIAETSLFAPSAKITLGVAFGKASPTQLAIGYMDEVSWKHGAKTVGFSGRNSVGFFLNDQTFDEEISFNASAVNVIPQIFERFGITKFAVDPLGTATVKIDASPADTGMKIMQAISNLLSDVTTPGKNWDIEELYDGTVVAGFDAFRASYSPKGIYLFNGANDVFTKTINRSIDGSYTHVRCTGTDANKKDLTAVVMPVTPIRYWEPGEHKTYHAAKVDGITQEKLNKYCEVLAQQLKEAGRLVTYKSTLRPQLLVGDVAEIASSDPDEPNNRLGIITEIRHSFGAPGYFTEFTASSGGEITTMESQVYTKVKSSNGNNRTTRINDLMAKNTQQEVQQAQEAASGSKYIAYDYAEFDGTGHIELPITLMANHQINVRYRAADGLSNVGTVFGNSAGVEYACLRLDPQTSTNYTSLGQFATSFSTDADLYLQHHFTCNKDSYNWYDQNSGATQQTVSAFVGVNTSAKLWLGFCEGAGYKFKGRIYRFTVTDNDPEAQGRGDATLLDLYPREYMVDGALVGSGLYDRVSGRFYTCSGMKLGNE